MIADIDLDSVLAAGNNVSTFCTAGLDTRRVMDDLNGRVFLNKSCHGNSLLLLVPNPPALYNKSLFLAIVPPSRP